jgi:prepilin-type N-terminal cleavage/methylation domain-containing protein
MTQYVFALVRKPLDHAHQQAGFGMIELVAAMTVMSVGILAVFAMLQSGIVQIKRASTVSTAAALADSEMEGYRAIKYSGIGLADADVLAADATYKADAAYRGDATTALAAAITTTSTTSISVSSGAGFPATGQFRVQIDGELMFVIAGAGTTTWTVVRGASGTTAATHVVGATVTLKSRVDVAKCGTAPCTNSVPTRTVTGADGRSYRIDTYMTWQVPTNQSGTLGRNLKVVTLVIRAQSNGRVYARVASSFDESTGL